MSTLPTAQTRRQILFGAAAVLALAGRPRASEAAGRYSWTEEGEPARTLAEAVPPPSGFERRPLPEDSFGAWLRGLPMKPEGTPVKLFSGADKKRQDVHAGVIDIDVGTRDLQQCADAVMRLRSEWLFATGRADAIAFNVTEGGRVTFKRWARGQRPSPSGKRWKNVARAGRDYQSFRKYMDYIFAYAGTASLGKELKPIAIGQMAAGDVFITGGFPGHAVLVADVVEHAVTGAKRFLLLQSYMPAQDIHVLKNLATGNGSPWYAPPAAELSTPEWTFPAGSLRRWPRANV